MGLIDAQPAKAQLKESLETRQAGGGNPLSK